MHGFSIMMINLHQKLTLLRLQMGYYVNGHLSKNFKFHLIKTVGFILI